VSGPNLGQEVAFSTRIHTGFVRSGFANAAETHPQALTNLELHTRHAMTIALLEAVRSDTQAECLFRDRASHRFFGDRLLTRERVSSHDWLSQKTNLARNTCLEAIEVKKDRRLSASRAELRLIAANCA
jgi:hypothetical protein